MVGPEQLAELSKICPGAKEILEGGYVYVHLPTLKLPSGCVPGEVEALLRPGTGPDGYETRLFLSAAFPNKGQNWTTHRILEKTWYTPSFNYVPADLRLVEVLVNHLAALR